MKKQKIFTVSRVTPRANYVVVTANTYGEEDCINSNGLIDNDKMGLLRNEQYIIAVGNLISDMKPGDLVNIDFSPYAKHKYSKDSTKSEMSDEYYNEVLSYEIPMFIMNNENCLLVRSQDITMIIDEYNNREEEISTPPKNAKLIVE